MIPLVRFLERILIREKQLPAAVRVANAIFFYRLSNVRYGPKTQVPELALNVCFPQFAGASRLSPSGPIPGIPECNLLPKLEHQCRYSC